MPGSSSCFPSLAPCPALLAICRRHTAPAVLHLWRAPHRQPRLRPAVQPRCAGDMVRGYPVGASSCCPGGSVCQAGPEPASSSFHSSCNPTSRGAAAGTSSSIRHSCLAGESLWLLGRNPATDALPPHSTHAGGASTTTIWSPEAARCAAPAPCSSLLS